jgi:hypothetical protein
MATPGTEDSIMNREQLSLLRLSSPSPKIRFPRSRPLALGGGRSGFPDAVQLGERLVRQRQLGGRQVLAQVVG